MPYIDFAEIKRNVSIQQAAEKLNLTLKASGSQLRGPCPTCGTGGERALAITPSRGLFFCFGCNGDKSVNGSGDCLALVSHITGLDVKDAAEYLAPQERKATVPQAGRAETTAPKKEPKGFDKEKFADSLAYDGEVEDLSETVATRHRIGTKRNKLYIPICPPDVEPVCWAELHDGKLRLPNSWLETNVVKLRRA